MFTYADDTAIVFRVYTWKEVNRHTEIRLAKIAKWLDVNLLTLYTTKNNYKSMFFSQTLDKVWNKDYGIMIDITHKTSNCHCITKIDETIYLDVIVVQILYWCSHLNHILSQKTYLDFQSLRFVATKELLNIDALPLYNLFWCIVFWCGQERTQNFFRAAPFSEFVLEAIVTKLLREY